MAYYRSLRGKARSERERTMTPDLGEVIGDPCGWRPAVRNPIVVMAVIATKVALICFIAIVIMIAILMFGLRIGHSDLLTSKAYGRDLGQWEQADPFVREWYRTVKVPGTGMSCCGEADAYWADRTETDHLPDGSTQLIAVITDDRPPETIPQRRPIPIGTRYVVPPERIAWKHGNPTGHIVIFLNINDQVLCYVQNGGV